LYHVYNIEHFTQISWQIKMHVGNKVKENGVSFRGNKGGGIE